MALAPNRAVLALLLAALAATAPAVADTREAAPSCRVPKAFVENLGQWDCPAAFIARCGSLTVRAEPRALVLQVDAAGADGAPATQVVQLEFVGADAARQPVGEDAVPGRFSEWRGQDSRRWHAGASGFLRVVYRDLYPGVDLAVGIGSGGRDLEYDLRAKPGADLARVRIRCLGIDALALDESGGLELVTPLGVLRQGAPRTWREQGSEARQPVASAFELCGPDSFGFSVEEGAAAGRLVIDPGLLWSSYFGGIGDDEIRAVAIAPDGDIVVAGSCGSTVAFPTTPGAVQSSLPGSGRNAFVARFDPTGSTLVYSSYLGGSAEDGAFGVAVDALGFVYVVGYTLSPNFPTTFNAFQKVQPGGVPTPHDGFVAKIDPTGTALVFSTYLGGAAGQDAAYAVAVDGGGQVTVGGGCASGFPTTPGAFDTSYNLGGDGFVARLNAGGSALVYSTVLGAVANDDVRALALAANGEVVVTGKASPGFPSTAGAFDPSHNGADDAYVARLSSTGSALLYCTFLGGAGTDFGNGVALDASGRATVVGQTNSAAFPVVAGGADTALNGQDAFVARLGVSGAALEYATFLGGSFAGTSSLAGTEVAHAVALTASGAAVVVGTTGSADFPTTMGCYDGTWNGVHSDAFLTVVAPNGASFGYSTYLGGGLGNSEDRAYAVAVDGAGVATIGGTSSGEGFPTTAGAFQTFSAGNFDGFAARVDPQSTCPASWNNYGAGWPGTLGVPNFTATANPTLCTPYSLVIQNSANAVAPATLFIGPSAVNLPTGFGGTLLVHPLVSLAVILPVGALTIPSTPSCNPAFCGVSLVLQVLAADPGASRGVSFTPGLHLILGS